MSPDVMMERIREAPQRKARIAGLFYLLTFLIGGIAQFVSGGLFVSGDSTATATNLLAHERLVWLGLAAYLVVLACYIVVTALFYSLFKPVNRNLSLLAAFFSLVGCAIQAAACFLYLAPLVLLDGPHHSSVVKVDQLQALAYMFLSLYGPCYSIGFVFFGYYCLLIGYLILKSTFLPRTLGRLMMFAGLGWLTFLCPPLANVFWPYNAGPGIIGELSLTIWLLAKGVNVKRWNELAAGEEWGN
jgi:hypothetical protein